MLKFIYCDETEISEGIALDLLELSNEYTLHKLKAECELVLVNSLKVSSVIDIVNVADMCEATLLRAGALDFITSHLDEMNETNELIKLNKTLFFDLLKKQRP